MAGIPAAVLVLVVTVAILKKPNLWELPTATMVFMLVVSVLWGKTTTLTLTHDSIHYRSLLKRVDIALADVINLDYAFGFVPLSYKPYQRIVITVRENSGEKKITLNAGLFNQGEINRWVKAYTSTIEDRI